MLQDTFVTTEHTNLPRVLVNTAYEMNHGLLRLDDAVLFRVLSFIPPSDVFKLLEVCRALRHSIDEPTLWRTLHAINFSSNGFPFDLTRPLYSVRCDFYAMQSPKLT